MEELTWTLDGLTRLLTVLLNHGSEDLVILRENTVCAINDIVRKIDKLVLSQKEN